MNVNETKSVVALVQRDVVGLIIDFVGDAEVCIIVEHNGKSLNGGSGGSPSPLGNALFRGNLVEVPLSRFKHGEIEGSTDVCTMEDDARD